MRHEKKASATGILCPGRCCLLQVGQIMLYGCVKIDLFSVRSMDSFIVRQGILFFHCMDAIIGYCWFDSWRSFLVNLSLVGSEISLGVDHLMELSRCLRDPWVCLDSLAVEAACELPRSGVYSRFKLSSVSHQLIIWMESFSYLLVDSNVTACGPFFILLVPFFFLWILGIV